VGGKAVNLGRLLRAGFPVPDGFVVTTRAWEGRDEQHGRSDIGRASVVSEEILSAYRELGSPVVAVRSSATMEDGTVASMAGQYETVLNVAGEQALLDAVRHCRASLDAPRVHTYLSEHGIDRARVAMAVVVQRLVPADVAGVLFTTNPQDGRHQEMLLEASWGLGEMVVSGQVQPDVLRLEQDTGRVVEASIADKKVRLAAGTCDDDFVSEPRRWKSCLRGRDVYRLWQLGKRVAEHFDCPQDIEWAIHGGQLYLLQSRPITTLVDAEAYEQVLRATQDHLRQQATAGRGPWVLHNLAETLPHATPLTWSIIQRLMSGSGGFGTMYRQVGFNPSAVVCREGFLECIAGRIYMDVARAPEMLFEDFPFAFDLDELKQNPDTSQIPPTLPRRSFLSRCKAQRKLKAVQVRLNALSATLEQELRGSLFEDIAAFAAGAQRADLGSLLTYQLLEQWEGEERRILEEFAPRLLLPSLIAAMSMGELRTFLQETLWDEDAEALAQFLSSGGEPDRTVIASAELYKVGKGTRSLEMWLAQHGHRAAGELDLAQPRWRDCPTSVQEMADRLATGDGPMERHRRNAEAVEKQMARLCSLLSAGQCRELNRLVSLVQRYIALREDCKDYLMLGYDLLRDLALEAGRRLDIGNDVFYLTHDELFEALRVGFAPYHLIEQRKTTYQTEVRFALPRVIETKSIDSLGERPRVAPQAGGHKALGISAGEAQGPVKTLRCPEDAGELGHGYILVCPSTDSSWTSLFVNAAGLVMECGGTLSHGAVVAREMGLPAVVLPGATGLFADGEQVYVDGSRGWVGPYRHAASEAEAPQVASEDTSIPRELIPPPAGRRDRVAARLSAGLAAAWMVYLAAFLVLPQPWVRQPTMRTLDGVLWPIARSLGKPAVVALVAMGVALLALLVQRLVTDNRRLWEAKRRAGVLRRQAQSLPENSPRRTTLMRVTAAVQTRTLLAAMIPVGILLGPMVMPFIWFQERIDPAAWNPPAGSAVQIVAMVDSNWRQPIRIDVPPHVAVDDSTPASRMLPPLRETLEHLLVLYRQPRDDPSQPWELKLAPDLGREQTIHDLQTYLDAGVPPQGITWLIHPPSNLSGRFPVIVTAGQSPPVAANVVVGNKYPPAPCHVVGSTGSPVKEVRAVYPRPTYEPVFWQPLAPLSTRLAAIDPGWLWLYILVYLVTLALAKVLMKVA
jgi:pyruvate,water dikinase